MVASSLATAPMAALEPSSGGASPVTRGPFARRDGLSKGQLAGLIASVAALHIGGIYALVQVPEVREAVHDLPIFVTFIDAPARAQVPPAPPPAAPTPPSPPKVVPPKPQPKQAPIVAAPTPAPAVFEAPPPPPVPQPEVAKVPDAVPAPSPAPAAAAPVSPAPPAPATAAAGGAPGKPVEVSHSAIRYRHKARIDYPRQAQTLREEGRVLVRITVGVDGKVTEAKVEQSSGSPRLDQAAVLGLRRSSFEPYMQNGVAVSMTTIAPYEFKLPEN